jgi:hypothetical protein
MAEHLSILPLLLLLLLLAAVCSNTHVQQPAHLTVLQLLQHRPSHANSSSPCCCCLSLHAETRMCSSSPRVSSRCSYRSASHLMPQLLPVLLLLLRVTSR